MPNIELIHGDCMDVMKKYPDKYFDLAICDPPYGIGLDGGQIGYSNHTKKNWDSNKPTTTYITELFRVSKNQIIWGFNHFLELLPSTKYFVFWNKHQNGHFAEGEIAWCSNGKARYFDWPYQKNIGDKIHPTQKPVKLYRWLLKNYAKEGDKILDTHGGSMSSAIACHQMGFDLTLCELDKDYYEAGVKRFKEQTMQQSLFK